MLSGNKKKAHKVFTLAYPHGSFHEVWHDCCNVLMTFLGLCPHVERRHYLRMGHGVMLPRVTDLIHRSVGHTSGLLPDHHNFTDIAAGHCLYPHPSFFPLPIPPSGLYIFSHYKYPALPLSLWAQHWGMCMTCWTDFWPRVSSQQPLSKEVLQLHFASRG